MERKTTAELLDEYFKTRPESTTMKIRGQIDRPELYAYEKSAGRTLVEMDSYDIAQMIKTFANKKYSSKVYNMSYRTYDMLLSILRDFFNWYIDNYEIIKNPCNDKKIKGSNVIALLSSDGETFDKNALNTLIERIRKDQLEECADYQEAVVLMFYEGFAEAVDIVNCKEDDVDHDRKTVIVKGREIHLSDRLYELLEKIHSRTEYPAPKGSYVFLSYRNSYFKFPTRERYRDEFNERPPEYWAGYISRMISRDIKNKMDININARTIYLLGFYDYIVRGAGQDRANELILSVRSPEDAKTIMKYARDYGVVEQNVTTLKRLLMPYIKTGK